MVADLASLRSLTLLLLRSGKENGKNGKAYDRSSKASIPKHLGLTKIFRRSLTGPGRTAPKTIAVCVLR